MNGIIKYLAITTLFAVSALAILGLNLSMNIDDKGKISSCSLMGLEPGPCQMTLNDHLMQWQQIFATTFNTSLLPLLLLAFTFSVGFITLFKNVEYTFLQLHQRYKRENSNLKLFDHLLLAFSRGILHPQIYA